MTSQRHIFILDANNNGAKLASYTTPSSSWSSPTIANGRLYIGNNDWNVYCFANHITNQASVSTLTPTPSSDVTFQTRIVIAVAAIVAALIVAMVAFGYLTTKRGKKQ